MPKIYEILQVFEETPRSPARTSSDSTRSVKLQQQLERAQQELRDHLQKLQDEAQQHFKQQSLQMQQTTENLLKQIKVNKPSVDQDTPSSFATSPMAAIAHTPKQV